MYHRKYFIKDLFSTRGLLNLFDLVQFESLKDFSEAIQHRWLEAGRNQHIIVKLDDYNIQDFTRILKQTGLTETDYVSVDISNVQGSLEEIYELLKIGRINVYLNLDVIHNIEEIIQFLQNSPAEWRESNRFIVKVFIDKDNYKSQLNSIIEVYMKSLARFFKIFIDYESLSNLTFKDFEDLKFRLIDFANWGQGTKIDQKNWLDYNFSSNCKTIILQDSKLYVNDYALRDKEELFDLTNKDGLTGEDLGVKELSQLRSYLDLKEYEVNAFTIVNGKRRALIDPYFNKKLTSSYSLLPPITKLMLTLFEGNYENR